MVRRRHNGDEHLKQDDTLKLDKLAGDIDPATTPKTRFARRQPKKKKKKNYIQASKNQIKHIFDPNPINRTP